LTEEAVRRPLTGSRFSVALAGIASGFRVSFHIQVKKARVACSGPHILSAMDGSQARRSSYVMVGKAHLSFGIRGRVPVFEPGSESLSWTTPEAFRRQYARHGIARAEALELELSEVAPGVQLEVRADLEPATDTTGGVWVPPPDLVQILLTDDPIGRIAAYVGLAQGVRSLFGYLKAKGARRLTVDSGTAMVIAAEIAFQRTQSLDLEVVDSRLTFPNGDYEAIPDGYQVTFRDDATVYVVLVSLDGTAGQVADLPRADGAGGAGPLG
jgi:hypothetical protein